MKSCENCYWELNGVKHCAQRKEKPESNVCSYHEYECSCGDLAEFEYKGECYCEDCIMDAVGIEKVKVSLYQYYMDGDYVGNSDESEVVDILEQLDIKNIKAI